MTFDTTLTEFVSQELLSGRHSVAADENLLAEGMVDSLGMLRLVAFIEERFGIRVPPDQFTIENFRSIETLSAYLITVNGSGQPVRDDDS